MNETICAVCDRVSETRTCVTCQSRIRGLLAQIPEQFAWLHLSRQRLLGGGGDGRSSKRLHAPTPGDERVLNMLGPASRQPVTDAEDQAGPMPFLETLATWCEAVADERGLKSVKRHVTTMTTRLTAHLPWIFEQGFVKEFFEEIQDLVRTCQKITLTEPRRELLKGVACPSCDGLTLVRYFPGDWAAECTLCPSVRLDERDYRALVQDIVNTVAIKAIPPEV
ncbi:hypothetical protein [Streptomyces similanensis]|uniref:Uncharacterized protein n=1 Tax=Streptomyces similanensis TaxID=1274988 RepID=A0ABP9LLL3_9ACTN